MEIDEHALGNQTSWVLLSVGQVSLVSSALDQVLKEVGRGLATELQGPAVEHDPSEVIRNIARWDLPPWVVLEEEDLYAWLTEVAAHLGVVTQFREAALRSRTGTAPRLREGANLSTGRELSPEDFHDLLRKGINLVDRGDSIVKSLGMKNNSGGTIYGYRDIARTLYTQAIDPDDPHRDKTSDPSGKNSLNRSPTTLVWSTRNNSGVDQTVVAFSSQMTNSLINNS